MKNKAEIPPEICKILNDKVSGSNILLTKLNNYFQKNIRYFGSWHQIIPRLKKEFSNFQAILKYLTILDKQKNIESAGKVLQMYKESERSKYEIIYKELYPLVKNYNDILTISNSKTVLHVLLMLKKDVKNLKVIVSESRPKLEGRTAARFLAKHGIKIEFIT